MRNLEENFGLEFDSNNKLFGIISRVALLIAISTGACSQQSYAIRDPQFDRCSTALDNFERELIMVERIAYGYDHSHIDEKLAVLKVFEQTGSEVSRVCLDELVAKDPILAEKDANVRSRMDKVRRYLTIIGIQESK